MDHGRHQRACRGSPRTAPLRCGCGIEPAERAGGRDDEADQEERPLPEALAESHAAEATGIETDQFSTHIFRRSTATLVEAVAGITLASRLLGHANEQITRASYVVSAELVDPVTADIIDEAFAEFL